MDLAARLQNPISFKKRKNKARQLERERNRALMLNYLIDKQCCDCGEKDPIVLDFDHMHSKKANVSKLLLSRTWKKVLEEIEKCEIRCANCHRRKTAKDQNWYKCKV